MKMEPNNIENQIREKLNSREIQPSAQAWDRLDAMLTVGEEKKNKAFFFLLQVYWNCCQRFGIRNTWFVLFQSKKHNN